MCAKTARRKPVSQRAQTAAGGKNCTTNSNYFDFNQNIFKKKLKKMEAG